MVHMERISDAIFTKKSTIRTKDPYSLALEIKEIASYYGAVKEKVHEYDTNGPRKVIMLVFDVKNPINKHTLTKLSFLMKGEIGVVTSFLEVKVIGKSITEIDAGSGFISQAYDDYYLRRIFPVLRRETESRLREISALIEQDIKSILYKYNQN